MKYDNRQVREWVSGVLAGIFKPEPNEEIWQWAERTMRIPATENEEKAGMLWSSDDSPYVRELMEWVKRPGKGEFWVRKSSQVGITMAVLIIICWMIVNRPGNIGYAIDSVDEARKISRTRLKKWITLNNLLEEIGEDPEDMSNLTYFFRGTTVYMLGAFAVGGWANKSIALFILDELDKHPYIEGEGTTVELARERCKRPKNAKIIGFSSPGETDQITTEWRNGTQEEMEIPFPCCGFMQPLKKEHLVYSTKEFKDLAGDYDLEKVAIGAYFKCQHCGGRLLDHEKRAALKLCKSRATNPKPQPGIRSLHIWDAYSAFVTFGEIAIQWIKADGNVSLLERLYRGKFGEQYEKSGRSLKHEDILACRGTKDAGTWYERGSLPFVPVWLTMAIDVQGDVRKATKMAVDTRGNFWVVDWRVTLSLDEAFDWIDEAVNGPDGPLYCSEGFCDEGHLHKVVRETCMARLQVDSLAGIWPVKGVGVDATNDLVSTNYRFVGGEFDEDILVYAIAEGNFKWELVYMISQRTKREKLRKPILYLPSDTEDDDVFVDEMCNEHPVKEVSKRTGKEKWVWKKVGPNDFWDTVKYCIAMWTVKRPTLQRQGVGRSYELKGTE